MSARVDFFEGVKNLHPPNQARKRFDRNYSGTGSSDNDNISGMNVRTRNTNENIPNHHISSWMNRRNSFTKDQPPPPPTTTSTQQPPFAYNEIHPRTSAHLHNCPSCDYPVMVQVTADLYYHHVTFIPAAMARTNQTHDVNNFVNQSQLPSQGRRTTTPQEYSPVQEPEEEEEVSTLTNEPEEEEEKPEIIMVTAPNKKSQQGFRTYASITAGKTIMDTKEDDKKPMEETEETEDNAHQEVRLGQVEVGFVQVIVDEKAKENTTASQVVDNGGEGDDDASNDGFTTVVSWKSKMKAKAAAKAKEAGHRYGYGRWKNRLGKNGRGSPREEHNKNSREPTDEQAMYAKVGHNDGGPRSEHDKRARGGLIRDGHDKHGRRGPRDEHGTGNLREGGHDKHGRKDEHGTGDPREGHDKHGRGSGERGQQRK
ncbi:spore wall protein 2-like isoform X1 [Impatiens glandulifera]|uniref:spore wall protein 2-like isoform X1 n=1 Tax=Impatiens glandulifera TaxID=253017 RepID=UPI001FB15016|nr:spore wall protein 2-like isoform X1 [Impatiens glandulifera]